jgi:bifunctional UDP-N-acetylglucosamine pyrophosphorylase/glucosamine-1-phosphate N-acetyltransferase
MEKYVVVLAAGKGTRMKSKLYKVLHKVCGKTMVEHVVDAAQGVNPAEIVTIVGTGAGDVEKVLADKSKFAFQEKQLGTGDAVMTAREELGDKDGATLVVTGDTPLFTTDTFNELFKYHAEKGNAATVLTAEAPNPFGYGRIIRDDQGNVLRIVEQKDGKPEELKVKEINTGVFCFDNKKLFEALKHVNNDNAQGEYYLTDVLEILRNSGERVGAYKMPDFSESLGVNDRIALAQATKTMQRRINEQHMRDGVSFIDPDTAYIDADVKIGNDTVIEGNVVIKETPKSVVIATLLVVQESLILRLVIMSLLLLQLLRKLKWTIILTLVLIHIFVLRQLFARVHILVTLWKLRRLRLVKILK